MKMPPVEFVARVAARSLAQLPIEDRINLLDGLSHLLPPAEAEQCELAAAALRTAEHAQMLLTEMLEPNP